MSTLLNTQTMSPPMDDEILANRAIDDLSAIFYPIPEGMENLDDYKPQSSNPITLDASPTDTTGQILTVENIELVYYADDMRFALPDNSVPLSYAQPVWRFNGHSDNGDLFEILVQALTDEYLQ